MWTEELIKFESIYKMSEIAEKNTLRNKLNKHLVLVINQKSGQKNYHTLPIDYWNQGETLRQVGRYTYINIWFPNLGCSYTL